MANAGSATVAAEPRVDLSRYAKLIDYLADKDFVAVDELPKDVSDPKALGRAWIEGLIQFGRREVIETAEKSDNNARRGVAKVHEKLENGETVVRDVQISGSDAKYVIETGYSWSSRTNKHMTPAALLAEKVEFKDGSNVYEIRDGKQHAISKEEGRKLLGLCVRISDKALTALAN